MVLYYWLLISYVLCVFHTIAENLHDSGSKRGTGARNRRKGVGTQGRRYARLMMRESEGEEAVHAYSVTAHVLYKGMESL